MKRLRFESRQDTVFLLVAACCLVLTVCIQQMFPSRSLLPFATVNGKLTRIGSSASVTAPYKALEDKTLTLKVADQSYTYRNGDLGMSLNEDATLASYRVESRPKRLIPFSMLAHTFRRQTPVFYSSQKGLNIVTSTIADGINTDPHNAAIHIDQSSVTISPSATGRKLDPKIAALTITNAIINQQSSVELTSKEIEPDITTSELEQAVSTFTATLPDSLSITVGKQSQLLTKQTMISWMTFTARESLPVVSFDDSKLTDYSSSITSSFTNASLPTPTLVSLTDGKETGRISGSSGKTIDAVDLRNQISTAISKGTPIVTAKLVDVASPIKYTRTYTRSSNGLKDLIGQIAAGKDIAIRYIDVNERGWDVGSNEHQQLTMASTYKLFVGYAALKRIDEGSLRMTDPVGGSTFDGCIQKMIVNSDNQCSIAIGQRIGWNAIVADGKAIGANDLNWTDDAHGSVSDCAVLLGKLARGEVLSESSRNYYLDLMKRQVYRQGIPAGTSYAVADKVGFLGPQLNDAAIVYAPDLTHVLVIYTKNESWAVIAEITKQIESLAI